MQDIKWNDKCKQVPYSIITICNTQGPVVANKPKYSMEDVGPCKYALRLKHNQYFLHEVFLNL